MSVGFVYGPANSGKSIHVYKKVLELASKDLNKNYIIVVPEQYALSVEKELTFLSEGHGIINIEVLSFSRLAYRIMESAGDRMKPVLNDIGKNMLIRNILQEQNDNLRIFKGKHKNLGFVDEIKSMISELCQYRITPEMLEKNNLAESDMNLAIKLSDIGLIYREFLKRVEELEYTTAETMTELCFKHIQGNALLNSASLYFDGFTGFTPIQYEFIERILMNGCNLEFIFTADKEGFEVNHSLFEMSTEMVEKISDIAVKNGYKVQVPEYVTGKYCAPSIEKLKNSIFRFKDEKIENDGKIKIYSARNPRSEVINAAARISDAIRNNNAYRYCDFAIICGDPELYGPYIQEIFGKYNIPVYIDENKNILSNPLICFISNALDVLENNYRKESVIALAKSPIFNYGNEVYEFENYLLSRNFRGKNAYGRTWENNFKGNKELDFEKINMIRQEINTFIKILDVPNDEMTAVKISDNIKNLLEKCCAKERLENLAAELGGSDINDRERLQREYDKVYDCVLSLLEQISMLLVDEKLDYRQFRDIFMTGADKIKLGRIPHQNDVVLAGDIKRTRLSNVKVLFMLGVNDGVVPPVVNTSGVLSLEERSKLAETGVVLADQPENKPEREEYYIYLALAKPMDELHISFARNAEKRSEENGALKPSYIIEQIQSCVDALEITEYVQESPADFIYEYAGLDDDKLKEAVDFAKYPIFDVLNEDIAKKLYGNVLNSSFSKIRSFAECPFKFFCQYGLALEDRPVAAPQAFDYGLVIHDALNRYMSGLNKEKVDWKTTKAEDHKDKAVEALHEAVEAYNNVNYLSDKRLENYVKRMEDVMLIVTKAIHNQLSYGDFKPEYFEQGFKISSDKLYIKGIVDRIDVAERNGKKLLKLIDYKTNASESFDATMFYNGIQLQLPLYMKELAADKNIGGEAVMAFYQHVFFDDSVERGPRTDPEEKRINDLRPRGMFNIDGENLNSLDNSAIRDESTQKYNKMKSRAADFEIDDNGTVGGTNSSVYLEKEDFDDICDYAEDTLIGMSEEIMAGKNDINPYVYNDASACKYCNYRSFCGFDEKQKCYKNTVRIFETKTIDDIKEKLKEGRK